MLDPFSCAFHSVLLSSLLLITSLRLEIILFSAGIVVLIWLSFFISGGEHALFSITSRELNKLQEKSPRPFYAVQRLIVRPRNLLVLVKTLQMIINVTILFLAAKLGVHLFHGSNLSWLWYLLEIAFFIMVLLMFQEVIPKYFAGRNTLRWARWMGIPLYWMSWILLPFTEFIIESSYFIEKRFARPNEGQEEELMEKPEEQLAEESTEKQDEPLLKGILKFQNVLVRQIMKSRLDVVAVDEKLSFDQLLKTVREARYSRLPVYSGSIDSKIVGILYTKDLLALIQDGPAKEWQSLIRPAYFVPEGKKISELLQELQQQQKHLAMVVDEYGRTSGLVTLEDIIEEIIGEIRDETDERIEVDYVQLDNLNYVFEGKTTISDFCRIMGISDNFFDEVKSESDSLGGLLLEMHGVIPNPNDTIEYEGFVFTILSLENYRIKKVRVTRTEVDERLMMPAS
jgi:gliding motility-associated protein GldE